MKTKMAIALSFVLACGLCMPAPSVRAAMQGTIGTNSTGSLNFSVTKPARADITNLSDLSVSGWLIGDGAITLTEDVCVYSTRPSGGYTVRATGSAAGGDFGLSNGARTIMYNVTWNDGGTGGLSNSGSQLNAGIVSNPMAHASTDSTSCSGHIPGPTARLIIGISEGQMSAAPSGTFLGILTLLIAPN